ncbi:hypothetical protein [Hymenobacter jeollabukensis]|uniref:Outer membrane protein beta-barrel domain-containing protein n=1 Tax=Hymenobacter jeollabukensis TaxID=2025313 RepID=A0A5R8WQU1_9BACT|nr:hypothetical protein [Hymenobacter jeollabukensis]TLM93099.1 hypothetical protein FDY95_10725 [Hymenobacter jeollabukensis]
MRRLLLPFLLVLAGRPCWAQDGAPAAGRRNALYLEGGGRSPYYAVGYEWAVWRRPRATYLLSAGLGLTGDELSGPLGLGLLTGSGAHHTEFGLGLTPAVRHYRRADTDKVLYLTPLAGYRYQPPQGRWYAGAGLTPVLFIDPPSYDPWDFSTRWYASGRVLLGWRW